MSTSIPDYIKELSLEQLEVAASEIEKRKRQLTQGSKIRIYVVSQDSTNRFVTEDIGEAMSWLARRATALAANEPSRGYLDLSLCPTSVWPSELFDWLAINEPAEKLS